MINLFLCYVGFGLVLRKCNAGFRCEKEYVELHNGGTEMSPIIGERLCNRQPSTLSTTDNMLYVKYFTDVKNPNNGFSANIRIGKLALL